MISKKGFTLVEILTVIFITAILLAIGYGFLIQTNRKAYDSVTQSYGRNMLTWATMWLTNDLSRMVADLPSACIDASYVSVGAEAALPKPISTCEVIPNLDDSYTVEVHSITGNVFTFTLQ